MSVTTIENETPQNNTNSPPIVAQRNIIPPVTASAVIGETFVPQVTAATRRSSRTTKKTESYAPAENPVRNTQVKWNERRWRQSHKRKGRIYKGPKVIGKIPATIEQPSRTNAQVMNFGTCYVFASSRSSDETRSDESSVNTADVNRQFEKARKLQE